jgi:glycosyltransferase involved in cell wall biosynthesis
MHSTPTVAYGSAGGTLESVAAGVSGLLVDSHEELTDAIRSLLLDEQLRTSLGAGALAMSHAYTWGHAQESFALVVDAALNGRRIESQDP